MQLDYEIHERPPGQLQLNIDPPRHTLKFPQTPRWVVIASIVYAFSLGTFLVVGSAWMGCKIWSLHHSLGIPAPALSPVFVLDGIGGFVLIATSWFMLRSYRRYGHLPRGLCFDIARHTLSHCPKRNPRWREWPLSAIASVQLLPIRDLLGRAAGATLSIRFRRWVLPIGIGARCRQCDIKQFRAFATELSHQLPGRVTIRLDVGG